MFEHKHRTYTVDAVAFEDLFGVEDIEIETALEHRIVAHVFGVGKRRRQSNDADGALRLRRDVPEWSMDSIETDKHVSARREDPGGDWAGGATYRMRLQMTWRVALSRRPETSQTSLKKTEGSRSALAIRKTVPRHPGSEGAAGAPSAG